MAHPVKREPLEPREHQAPSANQELSYHLRPYRRNAANAHRDHLDPPANRATAENWENQDHLAIPDKKANPDTMDHLDHLAKLDQLAIPARTDNPENLANMELPERKALLETRVHLDQPERRASLETPEDPVEMVILENRDQLDHPDRQETQETRVAPDNRERTANRARKPHIAHARNDRSSRARLLREETRADTQLLITRMQNYFSFISVGYFTQCIFSYTVSAGIRSCFLQTLQGFIDRYINLESLIWRK